MTETCAKCGHDENTHLDYQDKPVKCRVVDCPCEKFTPIKKIKKHLLNRKSFK